MTEIVERVTAFRTTMQLCNIIRQRTLFYNTISSIAASRHLNIPPPLLGIERVTEITLLGIDITSTLSTSVYVNKLLMQINQRMLLSQLMSQGMNCNPGTIFQSRDFGIKKRQSRDPGIDPGIGN